MDTEQFKSKKAENIGEKKAFGSDKFNMIRR